MVNLISKYNLREVQINPERDRYNRAQQQYLPKQIQQPILPQPPRNRNNHRQYTHKPKQHLRQKVQFSIDPTSFIACVARIHHTSHLAAGVDDEAGGFAIGEVAVTPEGVVEVEALTLALEAGGLDFEDALEVVDVEAGGLGFDCGLEGEDVAVFGVVLGELYGSAQLPVGLAIQLIRPDEHRPIRILRRQYHHIGRYPLITPHLHNIPHPHILRHNLLPARLPQRRIFLRVGLLIPLLPIIVIIGFLHHREAQHQYQRRDVRKQKAHFEHIYELAEGDEEEK